MPKIQNAKRKSSGRAIPLKKNRRYFYKIYLRSEVCDVSKIRPPEGALSIYDVIQKLAAKHGGKDWSKNPFSKLWPFRHKRVLIDGEKRSRVYQSYLVRSDLSYEEWRMKCQADTSRRTVAIREAAAVFQEARRELMKGLKPNGHLKIVAEAHSPRKLFAKDFHREAFRNYACRLAETGTLPPEALKRVDKFDREAEGELIYVYVTKKSLDGLGTMAAKAKARAVIDDGLRDWLIEHMSAFYNKLNTEFPKPADAPPTFPPTFLLCFGFALKLTTAQRKLPVLDEAAFHENTFRNRVWNRSQKKLRRDEKWRVPANEAKLVEGLVDKYIEHIKASLGAAPEAVVEAVFADAKAKTLLQAYRTK